jgi:outer membrane lipoprotein-sorting protein
MARWKYRFGIPLAGAAVALGAASLTPALTNAQTPLLQPMSASQLIAAVIGAAPVQYSGQLQITSNILGSDASLLSSVGQGVALPEGTSQIVVYRGSGPDLRLQMVDAQSERDLYVTSTGAWLWNSSTSSADHLTFSQPMSSASNAFAQSTNPTEIADALVGRLAPTSRLVVGANTYVAGHAAYTLTLTPRQSGSSISSIRVFIDAKNYHVLNVSVYSVDSSAPVLAMGYQSISFTDPSSANFSFTPPIGASVKTVTQSQLQSMFDPMNAGSLSKPTVLGTGWQSVVEMPKETFTQMTKSIGSKTLAELETPVTLANGGTANLIHTELVNLLVLPNGSTLVGAVEPAVLETDANALGL